MRAADTNVLVRLVTRDDKAQCERAIKFFDGHEVYLPKTVLLELEWVLRYSVDLRVFHAGDPPRSPRGTGR